MKVLLVNKFLYPNGGSETYIFKLGEALFAKGHEVQYFGKGTTFVITSIGKDGTLNGIGKDGVAFCDKNPDRWYKTGAYYKEAVSLMNAIKERM